MPCETVDRMFGLCELQDEPGQVEDGCLTVEMSPNLELPSDWTFTLDAMPMVLSAEATPESMSRYGDAERVVRAVRSGR